MKRMMFRAFGFLVLIAVFSIVPAVAGPIQLRLTNGGSTLITDDDTGSGGFNVDLNDQDNSSGSIVFIGSVGNWDNNVVIALGTPVLGPGALSLTFSSSSTAANPGDLVIEFSEADINTRFPGFTVTWGGSNDNTKISYQAWYSTGNGYFQYGTQIGSTDGPTSSASFGGSDDQVVLGSVPGNGLYSLTQKLVIHPLGAGPNLSGGANIEPLPTETPEPSTMALLGLALFGTGIVASRRRVQTVQE